MPRMWYNSDFAIGAKIATRVFARYSVAIFAPILDDIEQLWPQKLKQNYLADYLTTISCPIADSEF